MLIDHWESHEIVLVEKFGDLVVAGLFVSEDERLLSQRKERRVGLGQNKFHQGHRARKRAVGGDKIKIAERLNAALELTPNADGVLHCGRHRKGKKLRGNASSSCFFAVLEKFDDFL